MSSVVIFAPSPLLTITVEDHPDGGDIHLHAGGQGVWQARMLMALDIPVTMCAVFSGETGSVLRHLLDEEGVEVVAVTRGKLGSAYVHDRRNGARLELAETTGDSLSRHELDELYSITLREALGSGIAILSGPHDEQALPADVYRRLAADLRTGGCTVIVDLSGPRLDAALAGRPSVVKVSDEELLRDGRIDEIDPERIVAAMHRMREEGGGTIIVTRADQPLLMLDGDTVYEVRMPTMEIVDHQGAGDSLTAGVAATLARGGDMAEAIAIGAAAGALNVTRHGLGTGDLGTIRRLRDLVTVHRLGEEEPLPRAAGATTGALRIPSAAVPATGPASTGSAASPALPDERAVQEAFAAANPPTGSIAISPDGLAAQVIAQTTAEADPLTDVVTPVEPGR